MNQKSAEDAVVALERAVQERWCKGDPFGYSDNGADDLTYFDHLAETQLMGLAAVKNHLAGFEGKVDVPRSEMANTKVRVHGDMAVLTFNWYSYSKDGDVTSRWNATEVFRRAGDAWKYVHMHWSIVQGK